MSLAFLKKQLNDVDGQICGFWQGDAVRWRRPGCGLPDPQRGWGANWHDLRDWCLTVEDCYSLAAAHGSK
ncbi:MAG: hypothetical protein ACRDGN_12990, partial [bacterium]